LKTALAAWLLLILLGGGVIPPTACPAAEPMEEPAPLVEGTVVKEKPSIGHRLLYYIPNRLLDIVDVFRLRARLGPGLAASARATEYISFFGGTYNTVYGGLPGARSPEKWRSPVGFERYKGIVFFGVDATDVTPYGPRYTPAEFEVGAQLLILGADIGFEPVELGDLLAGLVLFDPIGDDL
jgi:hypothetical protein